MGDLFAPFAPWMARWSLEPDGEPFLGPWTGNGLAPVRQGGIPAMLKIAESEQEQLGGAVLEWWAGQGAAPVLAREGKALLMLRADDDGKLKQMARKGRDAEANAILCGAIEALHRPRAAPPPDGLRTLPQLFRALREAAARDDRFGPAWAVAAELLAEPREVVVLHGDMHHENVLDFGPRGWLAIDGWGVLGERTYDYANIPRNPDMETAEKPGRIAVQVAMLAELGGLDRDRLARWTMAHAWLSTAWCIEDGIDAVGDALQLAEMTSELI